MSDHLLRLGADDIARCLGISHATAKDLIATRVREGKWTASGDAGSIIISPADLNAEIDAIHEPPPATAAKTAAPTVGEAPITDQAAELALAKARNEEQGRLISAAKDALEQAQQRLVTAKEDRAELNAARARIEELTEQLLSAKTQLIDAYDRIIEMQRQPDPSTRNEPDAIGPILERLKKRNPDG